MLTLKASVAATALVCTALVSAGAGYAVSRATMTANVAMTCPTPAPANAHSELPSTMPSGPTPPLKGWKSY